MTQILYLFKILQMLLSFTARKLKIRVKVTAAELDAVLIAVNHASSTNALELRDQRSGSIAAPGTRCNPHSKLSCSET